MPLIVPSTERDPSVRFPAWPGHIDVIDRAEYRCDDGTIENTWPGSGDHVKITSSFGFKPGTLWLIGTRAGEPVELPAARAVASGPPPDWNWVHAADRP